VIQSPNQIGLEKERKKERKRETTTTPATTKKKPNEINWGLAAKKRFHHFTKSTYTFEREKKTYLSIYR
jgi:hypothetical protein